MEKKNDNKGEQKKSEKVDRKIEGKESTRGETEGNEQQGIEEDENLTGPDAELSALKEEVTDLKQKSEEYYEKLQRQQAEFDNYRKRTQKEKEDLVKYAAERILTSMLPVVDNFERALAASQNNSDIGSLTQGVEMIFRQMKTILEQEGLKPIEAVGQPFDPNLHEAVLQVNSEEHEENTVVEELQKGYYLKDKVVRPSMVKVAR